MKGPNLSRARIPIRYDSLQPVETGAEEKIELTRRGRDLEEFEADEPDLLRPSRSGHRGTTVIGRAIAEVFAAAGAEVVVTWLTEAEVEACRDAGGGLSASLLNVADQSAIDRSSMSDRYATTVCQLRASS